MPDFTQPSEIAREALLRLAQRRIPPTPDNYLTLYHEIAGTQPDETFPERSLKSLVAALPRQTADQNRAVRLLESAVGSGQWTQVRTALLDILGKTNGEPLNWSALLKDLLNQANVPSAGLTVVKKRESLDHVLAASATPELLHQRLSSLLRGWSQNQAAEILTLVDGEIPAPAAGSNAPAPAALPVAKGTSGMSGVAAAALSPAFAELRGLLVQLLENGVAVLIADSPEMIEESGKLVAALYQAADVEALSALAGRLKKFSYRLQFVAEDQAEMRGALLHLLQLLVENIQQLVVDDQWLHGQIAVVADLVSQPPSLRRMDDVERKLKDMIYKQSALKKSLVDAQDRLKAMLATFVDRLADFSVSTGDYHDKIERCAERISKAGGIAELTDVLDEVMRETRVIQHSTQRSRDELMDMRRRADEADKEISRLQQELAEASEMVRHDPMTGALNRRGMDDALAREVARARRHEGMLCMALLDVDNFKRLNDTLGHEAGDAALIHLAKVIRETIRPQDTLARYGGEEFVVLLPDTVLEDGINAMVRVQRELTRKFFLHKNEKLLITFSCGVAELGQEEVPEEALKRADAAMYLAKRSGKNRVMAA